MNGRENEVGAEKQDQPIRVGVSACLLGREVRYDGGHKRDAFLTDTLGRFFQWVEVCPEVHPRLVFARTGIDQTPAMQRWSRRRLDDLARHDLRGYILKSGSPSCGMERGTVSRSTTSPSARTSSSGSSVTTAGGS